MLREQCSSLLLQPSTCGAHSLDAAPHPVNLVSWEQFLVAAQCRAGGPEGVGVGRLGSLWVSLSAPPVGVGWKEAARSWP